MSEIFTGEWYPWYPAKALTSEAIDGLSLIEEAAYRRALDKAWIKGSLPADPKDLAKVIGKGCSVKIAARVLELFKPMKGNKKRVVNLPQERIRAEQAERHQKAVERATKAANARHSKNGRADATSKPQAIVKDAIYIEIDNKKEKKKEEDTYTRTREAEKQVAPAVTFDAVYARALGYPLADLFKFFPRLTITPAQCGMIQAEVKDTDIDRAAWSETIKHYVGNHDPSTRSYMPEKVGNLLSVFKSKRTNLEKEKNGSNQPNRNGTKQTPAEIIASRPYR